MSNPSDHSSTEPVQDAVSSSQRQASASFSALNALRVNGVSTLSDTFSCRNHSHDFSYARSDYLRDRVGIVGVLFLILVPGWFVLDFIVLPEAIRPYTLAGRAVMILGFILTIVIARYSAGRFHYARLSAGLLFFLPAAFYLWVLFAVSQTSVNYDLVGYSFIPFMLMVMLTLFPFTLLESGIVGLVLLASEALSQLLMGTWMTPAGLQGLWLLVALFAIALAANYFHLGLLLRLYREATHDPLTGLLNRGALAHSLEQMQHSEDHNLALLMMDLDHFKRINDLHGHSVGDRVLSEFARILRQQVGRNDFAARYGGEEFVVVLTKTTKEQALASAETIRRCAELTPVLDHHGNILHFTVSIGVATFRKGETFDQVARRADDRLYEAKKLARNCVVGT